MSERKTAQPCLRARAERFAAEYLLDADATAAALRAGYAPSTAARMGRKLLEDPAVQARLAALGGVRAGRTEVTAERIVEELARIAFADGAALLDTDIPASAAEAGAWGRGVGLKVKFTPSRRATGADGQPCMDMAMEREVRIGDKLRALGMLARHMGLDLSDGAKAEEPCGLVLLPEAAEEDDGE